MLIVNDFLSGVYDVCVSDRRVSKVVAANGEPLVVYHGTRGDFDSFYVPHPENKQRFYFSADPGVANEYANDHTGRAGDGSNVMPVYLSVRKPAVVDAGGGLWAGVDLAGVPSDIVEKLSPASVGRGYTTVSTIASIAEGLGCDGLIVRGVRDGAGPYGESNPTDIYVAFRPEQIKSAVGNNGNFDPANPSILKKVAPTSAAAGLTPDAFRAALVERFGEAGVRALEARGLLNILDPDDPEVSEDRGADLDPDTPAWYNPATGEAFFVPRFIRDAQEAVALVLHEVGEHHGLRSMLGDRAWRTLKARIASLAREGKNDIRAAWDGVIDTYPEFRHLAGVEPGQLIDNDRFMHEVIAKVGETAAGRKSGLWRDLLAAVNRFLLKLGVGRQINKNELADLVAGSLKRVMGGEGVGWPAGRTRGQCWRGGHEERRASSRRA